MASPKTILINGRTYDAVTGLPVDTKAPTEASVKPAAQPAPKKPAASRTQATASTVHSTVQRSKTLHRRVTKKPAAPKRAAASAPAAATTAPIKRSSTATRHMDIAPHPNVSKFAKNPVVKPAPVAVPKKPATVDRPARVHPTAQKAIIRSAAKKTPQAAQPATAKQVKDVAITKALAASKAPTELKARSKKKSAKNNFKDNKWFRRLFIITAIAVLLAGTLFVVYRLVPSVSVGIASAQAGISASYPEYTPDGYSLSHPVVFSDGEVDLKFRSNSDDNSYTIVQTRSSWDSSAVLDNVVEPASGANYMTTKERGLTIFTFDNNASWVNGGILYKINSKAPLSSEQIRRIATSL